MGQDALFNLGAFSLQVAIIVAAAALLLRVLRIAAPGARYACWRSVLVACLAMPLLLQRPATPPAADDAVMIADGPAIAATADPADGEAPLPVSATPPAPWGSIAALVILIGAVARGGWLAIGLVRLRALRRRGLPIEDADYAEIQRTLGTRAALSSVDGLTQPATFGVWRPVVLLPDTLAGSPVALRRAVVTHELFHVQRRDWLWVLGEEALRTVLWFHPAIAWLTSRIQLAREELVDELTVLATGNRKAYIEALLVFADGGRTRPAPAFARRRHLFTRIVRLSKESVMSSPRIVVSAAAVIAAVVATGWFAGSAFPIVAAAAIDRPAPRAVPASASASAPAGRIAAEASSPAVPLRGVTMPAAAAQGARTGGPRPRPAAAAPQASAPDTKPITPENPIPRRLSSVPVPYPVELTGSGYRANLTLRVTLDASGTITDVRPTAIETAGGDSGGGDRARAMDAFSRAAADAVKQWRYQPPADPPIAFFVAVTFDGEREARSVQSDSATPGRLATVTFPLNSLPPGALAETERLLAELMARRADLARLPPAAELQRLDEQIREIERRKNLEQRPDWAAPRGVTGPGATAGQPVRVGGNIRPPAKTKHVDPEYPEIAKSARVQGVVILDATIDEQGRIAQARILRSIPLLDQAALDAVRQWEFTPTLLNGAPVPVVMTMTVQFSLPAPGGN